MNILINGEKITTNSTTLADLLLELNYPNDTVATAVNGDFIAKADRETTPLAENSTIDIVAPMQGG
jgi:sulfur carrier protein